MKKILVLIILLWISVAQRGGGRSSGGKSSSSSSSGSSRSSGTFFRGQTGPVIFFTRDHLGQCLQMCRRTHIMNPPLQLACMNNCQIQQLRASNIAYGIVGSVFLCLLACFTCSYCCNRTSSGPVQGNNVSDGQEYQKRLDFIQQTKRRVQAVSTSYMPHEQFEIEKEKFESQNWKFYYFQYNTQNQSQNLTFSMHKESPFVYSFTSRGSDNNGSWGANGYFFCTSSGIKIWMLKDYDNKEAAGQTDDFGLLYYQGAQMSRGRYQGDWFYVGYQRDREYSGKWVLVSRNAAKPNNPYVADFY